MGRYVLPFGIFSLHVFCDFLIFESVVQPDADFECLSVLMHHTQDVKCVAWHPKEEESPAPLVFCLFFFFRSTYFFLLFLLQLLASGSYDDNILLYMDDPSDDWYPFTTLKGHTSTVWSLAFSPCGSLLASASDDCSLRIWQRLPKEPIINGVGLEASVQLPSGDGQWQPALIIPNAHERSLYSISWALPAEEEGEDEKNKGWIASAGGDGSIKIWQVELDETRTVSHRLIAEIENAHGVADVNCVTWSPRIRGLLASSGDDFASRVWRVVREKDDVIATSPS